MGLDTNTKTTWPLVGRIALAAACVIVTILSLSRLGIDEWNTFLEWLSQSLHNNPLGFAIIVAGIVNLFLLFGLYLWGDKRTRQVLLPMCILLPPYLLLFQYIIFLFPIVNLILLLALIPCAIEAIIRKKTLLGIMAALWAFYLLAGLYICAEFWSAISHLAK